MNSRMVEKIQNLMALAKDQAGLPEGELAAKFAAELMAKHSIRGEEVEMEKRGGITDAFISYGKQTVWRRYLFQVVADFVGVRVAFGNQTDRAIVVGLSEHMEVFTYLYDVILRQVTKAGDAFYQDNLREAVALGAMTVYEARAVKEKFLVSAASGVKQRMEEIKRSASSAAGLAIVKSRDAEVEDYFARVVGKVKTKTRNISLLQAGVEAGRNITIHHGVGAGATSPKLLNGRVR